MSREAARRIVADRGDARLRIDRVICRHLAADRVSRTRVQRWIDAGLVLVNGTPVSRASARATSGDTIEVPAPATLPRRVMRPERRADLVRVLYEDEHLLAVDKPAGLVVHPTFGHPSGTLLNALLWYARDWAGSNRPALVGRLDKDTSGVLLVSKNTRAHAALQRATAAGAARKEYLAVVYGRVRARGTIDLPLGPDPHDRRRTVTHGSHAAPSTTRFERLARRAAAPIGLALLRCTLGSGRRHQIRAHLAAHGWPIVGDALYGRPLWAGVRDAALGATLRRFPRQALHAERVGLVHPFTKERLDICAPVPADLAALLVAVGF